MNISSKEIEEAGERLRGVVIDTPMQYSKRLSRKFGANIYFKREDLQEVRSFKIRGAYNKISSLSEAERKKGVVCASAGNHAQGVAFACSSLKIKGTIFMPVITPTQKINKVKSFGGEFVEVILTGTTYDEASAEAQKYCLGKGAVYVHPFNDPMTIAGQGTIASEIYAELESGNHKHFDGNFENLIVTAAIGGGGLISGLSTYFKEKNKNITVLGCEPEGAPAMYESLKQGRVVTLEKIDTFVDGAAVKAVGDLTFEIVSKNVSKVELVPEGLICSVMIELYQNEGIVAEPAGALSVALLNIIPEEIKGKTVVCVLSGGNNDILRYPEIMERSLVYQGRKHYFIIEFAQKPGQLRKFVDQALGPTDDIVRFEYIKKTSKEKGPALVGIELADKNDLEPLLERMNEIELNFHMLTSEDILSQYLI